MQPKCGSYAGWNIHKKNKEQVCVLCREFKLNYDKAYRKNPEKLLRIQERDRLRERNKDERIKANKKYRESHHEEVKERSRIFSRKRRLLKIEEGFIPYTEQQVLDAYGLNCHLCQKPIDLTAPRSTTKKGWENGLHIDHVIPISQGGPDTLSNVRPAHGFCNISRGTKPIERNAMTDETTPAVDEIVEAEDALATDETLDESLFDEDFEEDDFDDEEDAE